MTLSFGKALTLAACVSLSVGVCAALADDDEDAPDKNGVPKTSVARSLPNNGDPGGIRANLAKYGVTYGRTYTGEVFGNASGGIGRETVFEERFDAYVKADLGKLIGAKGLSFYVSETQINGTGGIRRDTVPSLATLSNIEAVPATRLFELYLEQKFADDKASLRVGQFAADTEFFISDWSDMFFTSGWPAIVSDNLPSSANILAAGYTRRTTENRAR